MGSRSPAQRRIGPLGTSLLVAAGVGHTGCEILAIANWLRRRDDKMACPVLHPLDAVEHRRAHRLSERR